MLKYGSVVTVSVILVISSAGITTAGEWHDRGHSHRPVRSEAVIGGSGLPSVIPGIGTFAGSISGVRIKGNGVFFAIDRRAATVVAYRAPKAKIIEISAEDPESACSFEAGVCVIRPQN